MDDPFLPWMAGCFPPQCPVPSEAQRSVANLESTDASVHRVAGDRVAGDEKRLGERNGRMVKDDEKFWVKYNVIVYLMFIGWWCNN